MGNKNSNKVNTNICLQNNINNNYQCFLRLLCTRLYIMMSYKSLNFFEQSYDIDSITVSICPSRQDEGMLSVLIISM